ncbi:hypothetical protein F5141DRAFT_1067713 [Pisolithus sp. B1]|nr:hypothetical protein F5141DRAFT_1067713 [Pisolithus sp. B1]
MKGASQSPIDCAKTTAGHAKPKTEVVDAWQLEDNLPEVEDRAADSQQPEECASALDAPDEGSQCESNEVAESRDLPESNFKAFEPTDNTGQTSGCPTEHVPQMSIEENQHTWTHSKMIANIPDPPWTYTELPTPHIKSSTLQNRPSAQAHSAMTTEDPGGELGTSSQL